MLLLLLASKVREEKSLKELKTKDLEILKKFQKNKS
jgi:hypothetical protein